MEEASIVWWCGGLQKTLPLPFAPFPTLLPLPMGQFSGKLSKLLNINDDDDDDIYYACSPQINSFLETPPSVISYYLLEWGGHGLIPSISQRHLQSGNAVQNNVQNGVNCQLGKK